MAVTKAFGEQIREFARKADAKADVFTRKVVFDIGTSLVLKSPVGDPKYWKRKPPPGYVGGRFRANWQYGQNSINRMTTEQKDKSGGPTINRIVGRLPEKMIGSTHNLTNSLPYAIPLENGWSWRQAPNGMVQVTILEFDPIIRRAAAAV